MPCPNCGQVFSAFLEQMAEHNAEVVCPHCGQSHTGADLAQATRRKQD